MKRYAAISADIVASTSLSPADYVELMTKVKKTLSGLSEEYVGFWGRVIKGDSIECVVDNPNDSLRIALLLKALVKSYVPQNANVKPDFEKYGLRFAVGIGKMRLINKELDIMDGEAIYLSGRALDSVRSDGLEGAKIVMASDLECEGTFSAIAPLLNRLIDQATARQCETLFYRLQSKRDLDVAKVMKISRAGVNSNLRSLGWDVINHTLITFEKYNFKTLRINATDFVDNSVEMAALYRQAGVAYLKKGMMEKSQDYFNESLEIYAEEYGSDNLMIAKSYLDVATDYISCNEYNKAIDCLQKSLVIRKKILGENSPLLIDDYKKLSDLYIALNQNEEAKCFSVLAQNLIEKEEALDPVKKESLGMMVKEQNETFDIEDEIEVALNLGLYKKVLVSYLRNAATISRAISESCLNRMKYDDALAYGLKEIFIQKELLHEKDLVIVNSYRRLSYVYDIIGNSYMASVWIENGYKMSKDVLGDNDQTTMLMLDIKTKIDRNKDDKLRKLRRRKREEVKTPVVPHIRALL